MKSLKKFLTEKIIPVDISDINLIYKLFEPIVKEIDKILAIKDAKTKELELRKQGTFWVKYPKILGAIPTSKLKSDAAKIANEINPISILAYSSVSSNVYFPGNHEMHLGFTKNAVQAITHLDQIPEHQKKQLYSEFSEIKIKSTIRHELAHWLDDSLHNLHLTKKALLQNPKKFSEYLKAGQKNINLGFVEVEAVVSQIEEIKRSMSQDEYDNLTWSDLVEKHPSLFMLNNELGANWRRKIASRLSREGLLGKNMRF